MFDLVSAKYLALLEHLHCVKFPSSWVYEVLLLDEKHLSVGSLANNGEHLEVLLCDETSSELRLLYDLFIGFHFLVNFLEHLCVG